VIGMLQKILGSDTVAGNTGIARQLQVLLQHLIDIAAHPGIGSAAVETLTLIGHAAMRLARPTIAAASVIVVAWSHASIIRFCCGVGFSAQFRGPTAIERQSTDCRWQVQTPRLKRPGMNVPEKT
jgi:hypothetical protein